MVHLFTARFAPALTAGVLLAVSPVPGMIDFAEAGSSGRAATRHNLTNDEAVQETTQSKARAATRSKTATEGQVAGVNKGKRSRRNPGATVDEGTAVATAIAPVDPTELAKDQALLDARIAAGNFTDMTGALALYQLVGKSSAGIDLTESETNAISDLTADTDLASLIVQSETRLMTGQEDQNADAQNALLEAIAAALGVPRPQVDETGTSADLGA